MSAALKTGLLPRDLEQAAVVTATLAYELAQQTQPFPHN